MSQSLEDDDGVEYPELPSSFFPPCWADEQRMHVLLAPFRAKEVNPINYQSKLNFWSNLIRKYCEFKGSAQVSLSELRHVFRWNEKKPYALETVIHEMSALSEMQSMADFMEPPQHTWRGWAQRSVSKAISWPLVHLKNHLWRPVALSESDECTRSYIVCSVVKNHADTLLNKCSRLDEVLNIEFLFEIDIGLTQEATELAVHELHCTKRAVVIPYTCEDGSKITLVKISGPSKNIPTITEAETNLFESNLFIAKLTKQTENLELEIQKVDKEVRSLLNLNKKALAKVQLRKKKSLEIKLEKTASSLSNLQTVVSTIHDTKQTAEILSAYKLASNTLKKSYADTGITVEKVDDALADVQEAMDDHREIQEVITGTNNLNLDSTGLDDTELEAELDALVEQDKLEKPNQEDKNLDESIEKRLKQLNISGFADLSVDEQREIISSSVGSLDDLLKHNITNKKMEPAKQ